jgi:hypothetical protein
MGRVVAAKAETDGDIHIALGSVEKVLVLLVIMYK